MKSVIQHISSHLRRIMRRVLSGWQAFQGMTRFYTPNTAVVFAVDTGEVKGLCGHGKRRGCELMGILHQTRA